ncbi:hypothetical protein B0H34DRAFT_684045 [Crassisporium funariophilum]|nr:hypothetical protein B0H34DRAFT_684045 [Crassisporium funariophilum]
MASRRLDISSLLCDDSQPAFSPLEALVQAATEERRRLTATDDPPALSPQLARHHYEEAQRQRHHQEQQQLHAQELERRRRIQEAQHLEEQRQFEIRRQHEIEHERRQRAAAFGSFDRQRAEQQLAFEQAQEERLREEEHHKRALEQQRQRENYQRDVERARLLDLERARVVEERQREFQRQQQEAEQLERLHAERRRELERHREEGERIREVERIARQQEALRIHEMQQRQRNIEAQHRLHEPITTSPHPPSISHLISHPPHRKPDSNQIKLLTSPISPDHPSMPQYHHEDSRPIKKRRYSESPTRPIPDDRERIAREREKMVVGELGYGRIDSPVAGPSTAPRRPGSGHGHGRKSVAVSELLVDKERPTTASRSDSRDRVVSPLGRRSPPGSQIGRAKAARKSDEHIPREIQLPPPRDPLPSELEIKKVKEEPKLKEDSKPPRHRTNSDEEVRPRKITKDPISTPAPPPPPPLPPLSTTRIQSPSKPEHDDAHEFFLQSFEEDPSPTISCRPEPPRSPSPSASPVTSFLPVPTAQSVKSPPPPPRVLTPITAAVALEQELEDLVSKPTTITTTAITTVKKQPDMDMDLDVDLAVTELVAETLEGDDVKQDLVGMEVDVEDELLSLVDDRPPPASINMSRRASGPSSASGSSSSHGSAAITTATVAKQPPPPLRSIVDARHTSPTISASSSATLVSPAVRHPSTRPASERGSMPPPATTNMGSGAKKIVERAGSVVPAKKKKEIATKVGTKAKATAGATSAGSSTAPPPKPRAKPAAKGKKAAAEIATPASAVAPVPQPSTSKPSKAPTGRKTAPSTSRSRSTSLMPGAVSGPPESDAVKAEKQEEEEDSDAANEDDKLYCVCKTKYDEDRFMIACDKCDEWYHTQCVDMPDQEVDLVDQFICPPCIDKNPKLNLRTTYKQRCLFGLRHPDPQSSRACHKAARGAFSKYCSDECGVKYMQSRIDSWAKKGGKPDKLWESVKNAEKREGVVVCAIEPPQVNGCTVGIDVDELKMDVDGGVKKEADVKPFKHRIVPPTQTKVERETERLTGLLDAVMKLREEIKRGMEVVVWREQLLQLASERAEELDQCGWDQRLCFDDEEWADIGAGVLESYEDLKTELAKEEGDGEMEVDAAEEQWWCPGKKVCDRHAGWQTVRYKDVCKEKEKKEEALAKLTTREREIRKRIEDMLDPQSRTASETTTSVAPLKSSNAKLVNGHPKTKATTAESLKKGKKRKAPTS